MEKTYMETATIDTVNRYATLQETKYWLKKKFQNSFQPSKKPEPQKIHSSSVIEIKEAKNSD